MAQDVTEHIKKPKEAKRIRLEASGKCKCPSCSYEIMHRRRMPCMRMRCPKCGSSMIRGH